MNTTITYSLLQKYITEDKNKNKKHHIHDKIITTKNRKSKTIDWFRTEHYGRYLILTNVKYICEYI